MTMMTDPTPHDTTTPVDPQWNGAAPEPPSEPHTEYCLITVAQAIEWLERNTHNRSLRELHVEKLAAAMLRGEWRFNGDAIRFSTDHVVLDGQHRLWALVLAGEQDPDLEIPTNVVFDLPPETQDTMDSGIRRSLADALRLHGETDPNQLAATLNRLHCWRLGESALRRTQGHLLTTAQALAMIEREPGIREAVRVAHRIHSKMGGILPITLIAACLYRFDDLDPDDSVEFWRLVATGENIARYHPVYELRQQLTRNAAQRRRKLPTLVLHALVIKAWNAYREGREVRLLLWKGSDRFPEPV